MDPGLCRTRGGQEYSDNLEPHVMNRASTTPLRRGAVLFLSLVVSIVGLAPVAAAQQSASTSTSADLTQDGWWNRAQGQQTAEPANPLRPAIGGAIPAPVTVPPNGLGIGAAAGDPDKVAAVGIILDAPADALVDRLTLTLKETPENGSNLNTGSAKIVACPITTFFAGVKNGDFINRPLCDDSQSTPGQRAADGTWTFDLTLLASQWIDPTSGLSQNGVLLVEAVDAPVSFQTSLSDISTGKVKLDFAATVLLGDEEYASDSFGATDTFDSGTTADDVAVSDVPTESFDATSSFSSGSTAISPTRTPRTAGAPTAVPTGAPQVATPTVGTRPIAAIKLIGNLSPAAVVFFLLLLAGVGYFLAVVLGPLATPTVAPVRAGGVSRALAEREAAARNQ